MTQENKPDAVEEIRKKIADEFGQTHEFINVPKITKILAEMRELAISLTLNSKIVGKAVADAHKIGYDLGVSEVNEELIRQEERTLTAEKIKEEINIYRKQLITKASENPAKDLLINTGKILVLKDIKKIFAKFGVNKK